MRRYEERVSAHRAVGASPRDSRSSWCAKGGVLRREDNYTRAARWVGTNIGEGRRIVQNSSRPKLFPSKAQLAREIWEAERSGMWTAAKRRVAIGRAIERRPWIRRFDLSRIEELAEACVEGVDKCVDGVDYAVFSANKLEAALARARFASAMQREVYKYISGTWRLVAVFPEERNIRIGTTVRVYERK